MSAVADVTRALNSPGGKLVILGGLAFAAYWIVKQSLSGIKDAAAAGQGLLTGNNAITANATDAAGDPVGAYTGAGVLGTLGAETNAISGGWLASFGEDIGGFFADVLHPYDPNPASAASEQSYSIQSSSNRPYNPQGNNGSAGFAQDGNTDPRYAFTGSGVQDEFNAVASGG